MRILHVGYSFRPFHFGGLLRYAEDLMDEQLRRGDEVHYFFSGRHYPLAPPVMRRWKLGGVHMHELVNSPVVPGMVETGTRRPDLELDAPVAERALAKVIERVRPDVVHVQELSGLPSSVLELPRKQRIPVLMTLQDYTPLCPTTKLFDSYEQNCRRLEPAPQCVVCCRDAPGRHVAVNATLGTHRRRLSRRYPFLMAFPGPRTIARHMRALLGDGGDEVTVPEPAPEVVAPPAGDVAAFARRRAVNVERLSRVDRLVPMSQRVAEIYTGLGVDPANMQTMQLTVAHIDGLRTRAVESVERPIRFVTLNGCATPAKGARVVADALERLEAMGLDERDLTFSIAGHPSHFVYDRLERSPFVRFIGNYPPGGLDALLDDYDVGVVPSVWEEAYGYVGVEMLAKGLPVIGNAVGGIPEYTRDGQTGWLNRTRDGDGLAAIMASVVAEPAQIVTLNRSIRDLRSELVRPMAVHADELYRAYRELIDQSSRTAESVG